MNQNLLMLQTPVSERFPQVFSQSASANSEDPDQTAPQEQSVQGLHYLLNFLNNLMMGRNCHFQI